MKVESMVLGQIGTNCYFAIKEDTKEAVVIDPADRPDAIVKKASEEGLELKAVFLTHGHADHMLGVAGLKEKLGIPVYACEKERELLSDPGQNLSTALFGRGVSLSADVWVQDGQMIEAAGLCFRVFATPGHTPGGCCYYNQEAGVLFSGDTGFYSGSGSLMRELKARFGEVESSPYEVTVYPGISSVSALAARFGISWDDACLASAHGRDCDAAALLKEHEKVFLLLDSSMNLRQICRILKDADMGNTRIYAGVRMGYEDERKIYGTAEKMTDIETNSLTAVFLEREKDER